MFVVSLNAWSCFPFCNIFPASIDYRAGKGGEKKLPFGRKGNEETSQFSTDIINTMLATPFGDFCLCDRLHVQLVNCIIPAESGEQGTGKGQLLHEVRPENLPKVGEANRGAPSSFPTSHP